MSLQPYFNTTSMTPMFRGTQDWGMIQPDYNPFSNSLMNQPMTQNYTTHGLQPILKADILDRGDKYEVLTGKYHLIYTIYTHSDQFYYIQ